MYVSSISGQPNEKVYATKNPQERLKGACQDFEAIFIRQMLQQMRKSIPKSDFLDGGLAEDIYNDMLDAAIADQASRRQGFGIAKALYNHFLPFLNSQRSTLVDAPLPNEAKQE